MREVVKAVGTTRPCTTLPTQPPAFMQPYLLCLPVRQPNLQVPKIAKKRSRGLPAPPRLVRVPTHGLKRRRCRPYLKRGSPRSCGPGSRTSPGLALCQLRPFFRLTQLQTMRPAAPSSRPTRMLWPAIGTDAPPPPPTITGNHGEYAPTLLKCGAVVGRAGVACRRSLPGGLSRRCLYPRPHPGRMRVAPARTGAADVRMYSTGPYVSSAVPQCFPPIGNATLESASCFARPLPIPLPPHHIPTPSHHHTTTTPPPPLHTHAGTNAQGDQPTEITGSGRFLI